MIEGTMGKKQRCASADLADAQWPRLRNFLAGYFHEMRDELYGSIIDTLLVGVRESTLTDCQTILKEWRAWKNHFEDQDVRPILYDGFGVNYQFNKPEEAWDFMNRVYDALLGRIQMETTRE
jgi:hypothetical protein